MNTSNAEKILVLCYIRFSKKSYRIKIAENETLNHEGIRFIFIIYALCIDSVAQQMYVLCLAYISMFYGISVFFKSKQVKNN